MYNEYNHNKQTKAMTYISFFIFLIIYYDKIDTLWRSLWSSIACLNVFHFLSWECYLLISLRCERSCIASVFIFGVNLAASGGWRAEQMSYINPKSSLWYTCTELDECFDLLVNSSTTLQAPPQLAYFFDLVIRFITNRRYALFCIFLVRLSADNIILLYWIKIDYVQL